MAFIKFGTDGWRAVIADEFTFANVRRVSRAVARYIAGRRGMPGRGVVVGYDNRFLSEEFAAQAAEELRGAGIKVYMGKSPAPTPAVAFAVSHRQAAGAVMLTASHNPPEYHGIKFIPHYAGPALPEETGEIQRLLEEEDSLETGRAPRRGLLEEVDFRAAYLSHLAEVVNVESIRRSPPPVVVDPMYGAGINYLEDFLAPLKVRVETLHGYRDPYFGGMLPDPVPANLEELREQVTAAGASLGLALDGDADRLGVIDREGGYLGANQILPLLMDYLVHARGWEGRVARTVATTHLLDRLGTHYGLEVVETPVGFKYIGEQMRRFNAFLGGEESGGLSVRGHIPEKDGILGALLCVEMVAARGRTLGEAFEELCWRVGPLVAKRLDIPCTPEEKERVLVHLQGWEPASVGRWSVKKIDRRDGVKLYLDGGSWCLVRASGTEPLFRVYAEAPSAGEVEALQEAFCTSIGLQHPGAQAEEEAKIDA